MYAQQLILLPPATHPLNVILTHESDFLAWLEHLYENVSGRKGEKREMESGRQEKKLIDCRTGAHEVSL